jgi:uncharacterized protein with PQ loop repeat
MSSNIIPENFTIIDSPLERSIKKSIENITFNKYIIGQLAIFTGIISFFPIMHKMWITKNHSNFTWGNLCLALFSNAMWFYYGILSSSNINIFSGILFFLIYSYISMFKILY